MELEGLSSARLLGHSQPGLSGTRDLEISKAMSLLVSNQEVVQTFLSWELTVMPGEVLLAEGSQDVCESSSEIEGIPWLPRKTLATYDFQKALGRQAYGLGGWKSSSS